MIDLSPEMTAMWAESLVCLSAEQIKLGFQRYFGDFEECKFPPKPGQIIKLSGYKEQPPSLLDTERQREEEYKRKQEIK